MNIHAAIEFAKEGDRFQEYGNRYWKGYQQALEQVLSGEITLTPEPQITVDDDGHWSHRTRTDNEIRELGDDRILELAEMCNRDPANPKECDACAAMVMYNMGDTTPYNKG